MSVGKKDGAFIRNQVCVEYYNKIMAQNRKYLRNYVAKVYVVGGSHIHSNVGKIKTLIF